MEFKKVDLSTKPIFDHYLSKHPLQISDLNFTNILSWSKVRDYEYSIVDEHLVVSALNDGKRIFYQPVGDVPCLVMSHVLDKFPNSHFERVEKRLFLSCGISNSEDQHDMFDYIYDLDVLRNLPGKKFKSKRRFIAEFETYSPEIVELTPENAPEFIAAQRKWFSRNAKLNDGIAEENIAVLETLENIKHLPNILGVGLRVDGDIVGFAIGEPLNEHTFVEHYEKGDLNYGGVYQYLLKAFCDKIPKEYHYLNREQDMGIEGLRRAKESYYPLHMVEKVKISR